MSKRMAEFFAHQTGRLDAQRDKIEKLEENLDHVAEGGQLLCVAMEELKETVVLLYDYFGLEIHEEPGKTYITKRGQKKR